MDPTLTDSSNPLPTPTSNSKKRSLYMIIGVIAILAVMAAGFFYYQNNSKVTNQNPQVLNQGVTIPSLYDSVQGTIVSANNKNLTLKVGPENKTFDYSANIIIQSESSPSATVGLDTPTSLPTSAIKAGQIVRIQLDKKTNQIASLLILSESTPTGASVKLPITTISGTVASVGNNSISLTTNTGLKDYSFDQKALKVINLSRNLAVAKADQINTGLADVKVGNQVNLVIDNKTQNVLSITIK